MGWLLHLQVTMVTVAYMAKTFGIKATIVIPNNAPQAKIKAMEGYGAEIVLAGPMSNERLDMAQKSHGKGDIFTFLPMTI